MNRRRAGISMLALTFFAVAPVAFTAVKSSDTSSIRTRYYAADTQDYHCYVRLIEHSKESEGYRPVGAEVDMTAKIPMALRYVNGSYHFPAGDRKEEWRLLAQVAGASNQIETKDVLGEGATEEERSNALKIAGECLDKALRNKPYIATVSYPTKRQTTYLP